MTTLTKLNTLTVLIPLGLALVGCGPRSVAESFWRATKEGDFEKARLLATNDSREALDFIEKNRDSTDSRDFSVGDATVDGDKAICHTTFRDPQEEVPSDEIVTYLVREDGAWKVDATRTVGPILAETLQGLGGVRDAQNALKETADQVGEAIAEEAMKGIAGTVMEEMTQGKAESSPPGHINGQVSDSCGLAVDSQPERLAWIAPILVFVVVGAAYILLYRALAANAP